MVLLLHARQVLQRAQERPEQRHRRHDIREAQGRVPAQLSHATRIDAIWSAQLERGGKRVVPRLQPRAQRPCQVEGEAEVLRCLLRRAERIVRVHDVAQDHGQLAQQAEMRVGFAEAGIANDLGHLVFRHDFAVGGEKWQHVVVFVADVAGHAGTKGRPLVHDVNCIPKALAQVDLPAG